MLFRSISIFLILTFSFLDYDKEDNKYTILNILHLIFSYILLFLGVGASALLSQQIIIDSNSKYNEYSSYLKKLYEDSKESSENYKDIREKILKEKEDLEKEKEGLTILEKQKKDMEIKEKLLTKLEKLLKEKEERNKNKFNDENKNINDSDTMKLPMLEDIIKFKEEKDEEIFSPFKKSQSEYNINFTVKNENDEENKNSMDNIKNSIQQVDKKKLLLRKSNTLLARLPHDCIIPFPIRS